MPPEVKWHRLHTVSLDASSQFDLLAAHRERCCGRNIPSGCRVGPFSGAFILLFESDMTFKPTHGDTLGGEASNNNPTHTSDGDLIASQLPIALLLLTIAAAF